MHHNIQFLLRFLAVAAGTVSATHHLTAITIYSNTIVVHASDGLGGVSEHSTSQLEATTIPTVAVLTAVHGDSFSTQSIDYTAGGDLVTLLSGFEQQRGGATASVADGSNRAGAPIGMRFSSASDASYTLSGAYSVTDVGTTGNEVLFAAFLIDDVTGELLFRNVQISTSTAHEAYLLGQTGGDYLNQLQGSLTGTLLAGRVYRFGYDVGIGYQNRDFVPPDLGASARGYIQFQIDSPTATVPDGGSTLVMLGTVLAALAGMRSRLFGRRCRCN